jgi:hypothetical protein
MVVMFDYRLEEQLNFALSGLLERHLKQCTLGYDTVLVTALDHLEFTTQLATDLQLLRCEFVISQLIYQQTPMSKHHLKVTQSPNQLNFLKPQLLANKHHSSWLLEAKLEPELFLCSLVIGMLPDLSSITLSVVATLQKFSS